MSRGHKKNHIKRKCCNSCEEEEYVKPCYRKRDQCECKNRDQCEYKNRDQCECTKCINIITPVCRIPCQIPCQTQCQTPLLYTYTAPILYNRLSPMMSVNNCSMYYNR